MRERGLAAARPAGAPLRRWWPACRAARPPRRGASSASAGSPTRARTAPSCSSPGDARPTIDEAFKRWEGDVKALRRRARHAASCAGCACGSRTRARSRRSTGAARRTRTRARAGSRSVAGEAEQAGWRSTGAARCSRCGRRSQFDKGRAVRSLVERASVAQPRMFGGDDTTDLDAFDALRRSQDEGALDASVLVGVRSDEGPPAIVERADLVVDGVEGFTARPGRPGRPVRFRDLLRVSVLLFGGVGHRAGRGVGRGRRRRGRRTRSSYVGGGLVVRRRAGGLWLGRREAPRRGSRRCWPTRARPTRCRELEPGDGDVQPAVAADRARRWARRRRLLHPAGAGDRDRLLPAAWRCCGASSRARCEAIEGRDGVRVLARPELAVRRAAAAARCRGCGRSSRPRAVGSAGPR